MLLFFSLFYKCNEALNFQSPLFAVGVGVIEFWLQKLKFQSFLKILSDNAEKLFLIGYAVFLLISMATITPKLLITSSYPCQVKLTPCYKSICLVATLYLSILSIE